MRYLPREKVGHEDSLEAELELQDATIVRKDVQDDHCGLRMHVESGLGSLVDRVRYSLVSCPAKSKGSSSASSVKPGSGRRASSSG